jgi:hypothetical protein
LRPSSSTAIPAPRWPNPGCSTSRPRRRKAQGGYAEIARLEFSGKDRAAGKHWEDWVKAYNEKKAAGEKNIAMKVFLTGATGFVGHHVAQGFGR